MCPVSYIFVQDRSQLSYYKAFQCSYNFNWDTTWSNSHVFWCILVLIFQCWEIFHCVSLIVGISPRLFLNNSLNYSCHLFKIYFFVHYYCSIFTLQAFRWYFSPVRILHFLGVDRFLFSTSSISSHSLLHRSSWQSPLLDIGIAVLYDLASHKKLFRILDLFNIKWFPLHFPWC